MIDLLFDKFYQQFPNYKKPADKQTVVKGVLYMLKFDFKYWKDEDIQQAIMMGITGKWDNCTDFTTYNVRQWLMGYDKDYRARARTNESRAHQFKPVDLSSKPPTIADSAILAIKYFCDTGFMAKHAKGGYKPPPFKKYADKFRTFDQKNKEHFLKSMDDNGKGEDLLILHLKELTQRNERDKGNV